ncbi:5-oxoprolinase subunit PxpA [Jongsikchunia kroppenstedtii]|uniref:LamB/YcsF family protein n=1 Tax=Jongsikchunia kroppenstedtii TaxID=1121721 RepID=UPI000377627E
MTSSIDLNADLGESFGQWRLGDDEALLQVISSANVACGFHAGDPATLVSTCRAAAAAGVTIGAQVSYPDLMGFGRRFIDIDPDDLTAAVIYQIGALRAIADAVGTTVSYVKPHGALYNSIVSHDSQAEAVVDAVVAAGSLPLMGLPGSRSLQIAEDAGLTVITEAFADRGYRSDGTLVPRSEPGAVLTDTEAVAQRVLDLATGNAITAADGEPITIAAQSICLHGDTPGAVEHARAARESLTAHGIAVRAVSRR